jgi:hypothetical protein
MERRASPPGWTSKASTPRPSIKNIDKRSLDRAFTA